MAELLEVSRSGYYAWAERLEADPELLARVAAAARDGDWAASYARHPVVRGAQGQPALPLALLMARLISESVRLTVGYVVCCFVVIMGWLLAMPKGPALASA
jgi:hypothetical protein